ncbi:hypothetical protein BV898_20156, partial [Hypsibius exemplaris]
PRNGLGSTGTGCSGSVWSSKTEISYSVIDQEWSAMRRAFEAWLAEDNFDSTGQQKKTLESVPKDMS